MLTAKQCQTATCPPDKPRARLADSGGLYLEISPAGARSWFWKYRHGGKERRLALGSFPAVSLAEARRGRDEAKKLLAEGADPVLQRQQARLKAQFAGRETVEAVSQEWFAMQQTHWSAVHRGRVQLILERNLLPALGKRSMASIEPLELLALLRKLEAGGDKELPKRTLQTAGAVWRYGVSTGRASRDISGDLKGALKPFSNRPMAAITDAAKLGELLRAIKGYTGSVTVRAALQLAPMLFQRPGELRAATWAEIDLQNALWTIPGARMKRTKIGKETGGDHLVPLSTQAVQILEALRPYTEASGWVFPGGGKGNSCMSENALRIALIALGYGDTQTAHGFRATARTILAEVLEFPTELIECQLAHAVRDANGRSYNRTSFVAQRRAMMQRWADYLEQLERGAEVIPFPQQA